MRIINVVGFEGLYAVSDDGRIFSLKKGIELKPALDNSGYLHVSFHKSGKRAVVYIHKAVYYSFNAYRKLTREDNLVIDHIDGNKTNNRLENLRKITTRENTSRAKVNKYGKGVHFFAHLGKFGAEIGIDGTRYYLGIFPNAEEAAEAYQAALKSYKENGVLPYKRDRTIKTCIKCGQTKPISEYYHVKGHGYQTYCKVCQRAYSRQRREALKRDKGS